MVPSALTCPKVTSVTDSERLSEKARLDVGFFMAERFLEKCLQSDIGPMGIPSRFGNCEVQMRLSLSALFFGLFIAQGAMAAGDGSAAVGGGLGGVLGNVVGGQLGGSTGAAVGAGVGGAAGSAVGANKHNRTEAAIGGGLGAAGGSVVGNSLGGSTGSAIGAGLGGAAGGAVGNNLGDDGGRAHSGGGHKHNKYKHKNRHH